MNVSIGGIAKTVEITSFDKLGDVKVCMLTTTADGSVGFEQLNDEVRDTIYASFPVDTASGDIASFEDGADNVPVRELKLNLEPYQNLNGYDHPWVGGAGKNLYNSKGLNAYTNSGITATESNGTLTLNGTATANAFFSILDTGYPSGTYTWSFNNSAVNSGVRISFRNTGGSYWSETRADAVNKVVTVTGEPDDLLLYVTSGTTLSNFTIKPQFEKGSTATSWTPYENICPIYPANGKNLLENEATSKTVNGVTFTVNEDGSVLANGTASAQTDIFLFGTTWDDGIHQKKQFAESIIASIGVIGSSSTFRGVIWAQGSNYFIDTADVTIPANKVLYGMAIRIINGQTVNNVLFKPMLRPASISDSTYVPYNGIGITRTGKNLANLNYGNTVPSITSGQMVSGGGWASGFIPVDSTKDYWVSISEDKERYVLFYGEDYSYINFNSSWSTNGFRLSSVSFWNRVKYVKLRVSAPSNANFTMQLECNSSATTIEPYQGERYYPISDNPVYGGTLDVTTGVLTVTKGYVDLGSLTWERNTTSGGGDLYRFVANLTNSKSNINNDTVPDIKCSQYKADTPSNVYQRVVSASILTSGKVAVYDTRYATYTTSDFKTAMNGVQLVYPLGTPVQYQLTPTQVKTLLGYNNIWTDSGTVEVQYRANIGLYIQKIIGATEDDMVANQNISANKYFFVGETLYYSTSAISAGQTIIVGTNCIKTNLADALNALNS